MSAAVLTRQSFLWLALVASYALPRGSPRWSRKSTTAPTYLVCFLLAALPVSLVYQKYFDPFVLLGLALLARPGDFSRPRDYAGVARCARPPWRTPSRPPALPDLEHAERKANWRPHDDLPYSGLDFLRKP